MLDLTEMIITGCIIVPSTLATMYLYRENIIETVSKIGKKRKKTKDIIEKLELVNNKVRYTDPINQIPNIERKWVIRDQYHLKTENISYKKLQSLMVGVYVEFEERIGSSLWVRINKQEYDKIYVLSSPVKDQLESLLNKLKNMSKSQKEEFLSNYEQTLVVIHSYLAENGLYKSREVYDEIIILLDKLNKVEIINKENLDAIEALKIEIKYMEMLEERDRFNSTGEK